MDSALNVTEIRTEEPIPKGFELIDGKLVEKKMGARSSQVGIKLAARLEPYCEAHDLGDVFGSETAYRCFTKKKTGRKPDVSFIRRGRLENDEAPEGDVSIPPDLAVEVISKNDTFSDVIEKAVEYAEAGVRLLWLIDPKNRVAIVCRANRTMTMITEEEELNGEDVVAGFRCLLSACLPRRQQGSTNGQSEE